MFTGKQTPLSKDHKKRYSHMSSAPQELQALFLTTQTCEIFGLKPGTDVTVDSPLKSVFRVKLLADIATRRAISDFQPFKEVIEKYPHDSLVFFFDAEWRYGQNFAFALTPAAAENLLNVDILDRTFLTIKAA